MSKHVLLAAHEGADLAPVGAGELRQFAAAVRASTALPFPSSLPPEAVEAASMKVADSAFDFLLSGLPSEEKVAFLESLFVLFEQVVSHSDSEWVRERFWDLAIGKVTGMHDERVEAALVDHLARLLGSPDAEVQYGALVGLSNLKTEAAMGAAREFAERAEDEVMRERSALAGRGEFALT